ncbi:MAG: glutathionylspermidine synthase [Pseudomonadota bacterium]|jgi:glutathionylspermidine synthase
MKRVANPPRPDWQRRVEAELGFAFHSPGGDPYWTDDAHYVFSPAEVDRLDDTGTELHRLCLAACRHVVANRLYARLGIPDSAAAAVEWSWRRFEAGLGEFPVYGRFDLAWDGTGTPKLLEYNAATPTSLYETAVVQWHWLEGFRPTADQFNGLHEALVARWADLLPRLPGPRIHFCAQDNPEDMGTADYMRLTAVEAGAAGKLIPVDGIHHDSLTGTFHDADGDRIDVLWSLYPHEWFLQDAGAPALLDAVMSGRLVLMEPLWKLMLTKGILAILWELNPGHPALLKTTFAAAAFPAGAKVVAKPLWGREGDGVEIATLGPDGKPVGPVERAGPTRFAGNEGWVFQEFVDLPNLGGGYAVLGVWMVGDEAKGLGVREDPNRITGNDSRYVPHYFEVAR